MGAAPLLISVVKLNKYALRGVLGFYARGVTFYMSTCTIAELWYRDACKSEGPEHRFSGQTSRLACVGLFTPIDSELVRHSKTGLRPTHAILGQKSIFRPGQAQPASDPEFY